MIGLHSAVLSISVATPASSARLLVMFLSSFVAAPNISASLIIMTRSVVRSMSAWRSQYVGSLR